MFISESWQLKLWDESVFPVHIGSQFKLQPYGAGHICCSPLMAHIPMLCMGGKWWGAHTVFKSERKERENDRGLLTVQILLLHIRSSGAPKAMLNLH